jgi:hypothetical protein
MSYVYFIYDNQDLYKIGKSDNPISRVKTLQTGNPKKLTLYKCMKCESTNAMPLEGILHLFFLKQCAGGEWFRITQADVDEVCNRYQYLMENKLPLDCFSDILKYSYYSTDKSESFSPQTIGYRGNDPLYIPIS